MGIWTGMDGFICSYFIYIRYGFLQDRDWGNITGSSHTLYFESFFQFRFHSFADRVEECHVGFNRYHFSAVNPNLGTSIYLAFDWVDCIRQYPVLGLDFRSNFTSDIHYLSELGKSQSVAMTVIVVC